MGFVVRCTVQQVGSNWKKVSNESRSLSMTWTAKGNNRPHCSLTVKKAARAALSVGAYKTSLRACENNSRSFFRTRRQALAVAFPSVRSQLVSLGSCPSTQHFTFHSPSFETASLVEAEA